MKIGKLEGNPEEIKDFFRRSGLNIEDYLERAEPPLKAGWFVAPVLFVIASLAWLTLLSPSNSNLQTFIFLIGCGAAVFLARILQIRFKNTWAAFFVAIGVVLILLVAIGIITPFELIQYLKELRK